MSLSSFYLASSKLWLEISRFSGNSTSFLSRKTQDFLSNGNLKKNNFLKKLNLFRKLNLTVFKLNFFLENSTLLKNPTLLKEFSIFFRKCNFFLKNSNSALLEKGKRRRRSVKHRLTSRQDGGTNQESKLKYQQEILIAIL